MTKAEVFAPTIESIIRIAGTKESPAKNIKIRGLKLSIPVGSGALPHPLRTERLVPAR
jgi:hypothetical protein